MPRHRVEKMRARVGRGLTLLAREQLPSGALITQSALSKIQYKVVREDGTVIVAPTQITIATAVSDTPDSADARWTKDSTGPNFVFELPATCFPTRAYYRVEVLFTPSSGQVFSTTWEGPAETGYDFST